MRVLIVGGSGYLGQFLVEAMLKDEAVSWVGYTYHSKPLSSDWLDRRCDGGTGGKGYPVNVATGEGAEAGASSRRPCHYSSIGCVIIVYTTWYYRLDYTCVNRLDERNEKSDVWDTYTIHFTGRRAFFKMMMM